MPIRKGGLHLTFAAERPGASADQGVYAGRIELQNVNPKFDMPEFSWQVRVIREWGYVQTAGIFRKISWVDTGTGPHNLSDTVLGHGGLPAKSGVGGGIVAIAPGKGAIAVFAPALDEAGNSVKAQKVIEYVAQKLNYNLFSPTSVRVEVSDSLGRPPATT